MDFPHNVSEAGKDALTRMKSYGYTTEEPTKEPAFPSKSSGLNRITNLTDVENEKIGKNIKNPASIVHERFKKLVVSYGEGSNSIHKCCLLVDDLFVEAEGVTKKLAKQEAAMKLLEIADAKTTMKRSTCDSSCNPPKRLKQSEPEFPLEAHAQKLFEQNMPGERFQPCFDFQPGARNGIAQYRCTVSFPVQNLSFTAVSRTQSSAKENAYRKMLLDHFKLTNEDIKIHLLDVLFSKLKMPFFEALVVYASSHGYDAKVNYEICGVVGQYYALCSVINLEDGKINKFKSKKTYSTKVEAHNGVAVQVFCTHFDCNLLQLKSVSCSVDEIVEAGKGDQTQKETNSVIQMFHTLVSKKFKCTPAYTFEAEQIPGTTPMFKCFCNLAVLERVFEGIGSTKKKAKMEAVSLAYGEILRIFSPSNVFNKDANLSQSSKFQVQSEPRAISDVCAVSGDTVSSKLAECTEAISINDSLNIHRESAKEEPASRRVSEEDLREDRMATDRKSHIEIEEPKKPLSPVDMSVQDFVKLEYKNMCDYYNIKMGTELAAFVLVNSKKEKRLVSVASSSTTHISTIDYSNNWKGDSLVHMDPIVLARRGLIRYLLNELQHPDKDNSIYTKVDGLYELKSEISIVLYSTYSPNVMYSSNYRANRSLCVISKDGYIPIRESEFSHSHQNMATCAGVHCVADKIFKWSKLGVQGSFLSTLIKPLFISEILFGSMPPVESDVLVYSLCERLGPNNCSVYMNDLETKYQTTVPHIWTRGEKAEELCTVSGKTLNKSRSYLAKASILQIYLRINSFLPKQVSYMALKSRAVVYNKMKNDLYNELKEKGWGSWLQRKERMHDFVL